MKINPGAYTIFSSSFQEGKFPSAGFKNHKIFGETSHKNIFYYFIFKKVFHTVENCLFE